jgi:resuscitation-promoting factor RpfB
VTYPQPVRPIAPARFTRNQRLALFLGGGGLALLLLCCGGLTAIGALSGEAGSNPAAQNDAGAPDVEPAAPLRPTTVTTAPSTTSAPAIEKHTITEERPIPFTEKRVNDPNLAKGKTRVRTQGVAGVKTITYEVTLTDGVETARRVVSELVTRKPVTRVVAVGTKPAPAQQCDPNYSGACVPIASDVDCAGGGGNGPAYVRGPVRVIGTDIYRLDNDDDGIGCE